MENLTPKQLKKLKKVGDIVEFGNVAIAEHLIELEDKFEETVDIINEEHKKTIQEIKDTVPDLEKVLNSVKGQKGDKPILGIDYEIPEPIPGKDGEKGDRGEKGDSYILTERDKSDIAAKINVPIVEKIIEKTEIIKETPIVKETIVTDIDGKKVVDSINELPIEPEYQIDKKHIRGLEEEISGLRKTHTYPSTGVLGKGHTIQDEGTSLAQRNRLNFVGTGVSVTDDPTNDATKVTIGGSVGSWSTPPETPLSDGSVTIFTVGSTEPTDVLCDGIIYPSGTMWTFSSSQITLDIGGLGPTQFIRYR